MFKLVILFFLISISTISNAEFKVYINKKLYGKDFYVIEKENQPLPPPTSSNCDKNREITRNELIQMIDNEEDVTEVCTRGITDFSKLFFLNQTFNQDISKWDVSNGTNFNSMFYRAMNFNQPLNDWDVSKGQDFTAMFDNAWIFNQPLNKWNVSNGVKFTYMFSATNKFNQDISHWNVDNALEWSNFNLISALEEQNVPPKFR